jgi:hypothetical protein
MPLDPLDSPKIAPKMPLNSHPRSRGWPQDSFKLALDSPKWPQDGGQDGLKIAQDNPKIAQDNPKVNLRTQDI